MAFVITDVVRQHVGGRSRFYYQTTDAIATVIASGYFDTFTAELAKGDVIEVSSSVGGTPAVDLITVSSATGAGTVTTVNGT